MIQESYKSKLMAKFMSAKQLADFDQKYQSVKSPTANNLGQASFNQIIKKELEKILKERKLK